MKIVEEVTPLDRRCGIGTCQATYVLSDGKFLIIGKKPPAELQAEIQHKVAPDEQVIVIDPAYLPAIS